MTSLLSKKLDQQIVHHERTWEQFKLIQSGFADSASVRLFYDNGTIEILIPGQDHELFKSIWLTQPLCSHCRNLLAPSITGVS